MYVLIDSREPDVECGLSNRGDPIEFYGAFAFALETTTTVGYGLPGGGNGFFENCPGKSALVLFYCVILCAQYEVFEIRMLHLAFMYLHLIVFASCIH